MTGARPRSQFYATKEREERRSLNANGFRESLDKPWRFTSEPKRYETCQHYSYRNRVLTQCGAPTRNGKPTCEACAELEARGPVQNRFGYNPGGMF